MIVGVRPEHFEDADVAARRAIDGMRSTPTSQVVESMGSEIYAYFDVEQGAALESEELARARRGRRARATCRASASGHAVARVDAGSTVAAGERVELVLDTAKLHLFDPTGGHSLTLTRRSNVGVA